MKSRILMIAFGICCWLLTSQQTRADLALSKITASDTGADGNFEYGPQQFFWDTIGGNAVSNLYVQPNPPMNLAGSFINYGDSDFPNPPPVAISLVLTPGTHTFAVFGALPTDTGHFGINLFFNGNLSDDDNLNPIVAPQISAFAELYDGNNNPTFAAIPNDKYVYVRQGAPDRAFAAGQLSFVSGGLVVTLTDFRWNASTVYNLDRVGSFDDISDGQADAIGQFTLSVTSIPEPSSAMQFLLASLGLCFRRRR